MSVPARRWLRRAAVAAVVVLGAGFAVGSLVDSENAAQSTAPPASTTVHDATRDLSYAVTGSSAALTGKTAGGIESGREPATGSGNAGTDALGSLALPAPTDSVIKTADVGIEVAKKGLDRSWTRVFAIAARLGGFVVSSNQGGPTPVAEDAREPRLADIVIRVPAARFDEALNALSAEDVGKVTRRATSGQDVTQEFVDLESRLRHFRAQETVLLRIMSRANSIGDTIAVQQQLSQVQLQIEEITGRLRYLKDQTSFATISVHLAETGAAAPGGDGGPSFSKAWSTAVEGLERMGTATLIGATWLAPFAVLVLAWIAARRWRGRPVAQA